MSQENVEIVRRAYELLRAGELDAVIALYHPDAEWRDLQHAPDTPEVVRGGTAIFALWTQWTEAFEDFSADVYEYIDAHPWVVCDSHWHGTGRESGVSIDLRVADGIEIQDGKITRVVLGYDDVATALKAVGLEE